MNEDAQIYRPGRPKDVTKHEEIVTAATQLFMANGYELTSMEAVARQAGVSKLTIYSHFADKSELFRAIIQRRCEKVCMPTSFANEARLPVREALLQISRSILSIMLRPDSIRLTRVIQAELIHHPEIVEIYYEMGPRRVKAAFGELLREFDRQGQLHLKDPVRAAEQFFSLLKGELHQRVLLFKSYSPDEAIIEEHILSTVDMFLAAYQSHPSHSQSSGRSTP